MWITVSEHRGFSAVLHVQLGLNSRFKPTSRSIFKCIFYFQISTNQLCYFPTKQTQAIKPWKSWITFKNGILVRISLHVYQKIWKVHVCKHIKSHLDKMHFSRRAQECREAPFAQHNTKPQGQKQRIVEVPHLSYKIMASFCASCPSYWPFLAASWDWKLSAANQNCNTLTASSFSMYWKGNQKKRRLKKF